MRGEKMERLTKMLNSETVVYTQGKYEDTIPEEMTTNDVSTVLRKLAKYEDIGTPIELKQLKENGGFTSLELAEIAIALKELQTYRETEESGLLVRLPKAIEKQIPKKPIKRFTSEKAKVIKIWPSAHVEVRLYVSEEMEEDYKKCYLSGGVYGCEKCSWYKVRIREPVCNFFDEEILRQLGLGEK